MAGAQPLDTSTSASRPTALRAEIEILPHEQQHALTHLVVINEPLATDGVAAYLELCGLGLSAEQTAELIGAGLARGILIAPNDDALLCVLALAARDELARGLTPGQRRQMHAHAERFYRQQFLALSGALWDGEDNPAPAGTTEDDVAAHLRGLVDVLAHLPQAAELHRWVLAKAVYWQEQLFVLGQQHEAAEITDAICFALARNGYRDLALDLLARNAQALEGVRQGWAVHNLATLLREDQQHKAALPLYRRAAVLLLRERAYLPLAGVLSEMSNVHRDRGRLLAALLLQSLSSGLRTLLRDEKGKAICNNQLSILYRSLRLYPLALWQSRAAESYFRSAEDQVNLAKVLLTQGNLYNVMRRPRVALPRFEESLAISRQSGDQPIVAGATSGLGRACIQLRDFARAQALLEEAIALRQQRGDHLIGVEYENMGRLYEARGERAVANNWYHKALPYLEKYLPAYAPGCRRSIERTARRRRPR